MATHCVLDHGAAADGRTLDTAAVQAALDAAGRAGGGTVLIPAGRTVVAGSLAFRPGVELRVERGAVLRAAPAREEYYPQTIDSPDRTLIRRVWLHAHEADGVALTGPGTVDGGGLDFTTAEEPHGYQTVPWRPALLCWVGCRRVAVENLLIRQAACWTLHFCGCEDVRVRGVTIRNPLKFPNADGIAPDHCRRVRISDCDIESGDDGIVLKTTPPFAHYGPCEDVVVTNCTIVSTSSAIKVGSESVQDFRGIAVGNCVIRGSNRGVNLQLRDGGTLEDAIFHDLVIETRLFEGRWWGCGEPISVSTLPRRSDSPGSAIRRVRFHNIRARGENGVFLYGHAPDLIDQVEFSEVSLEIAKTSRWPAGRYDLRPGRPEIQPRGGVPIGTVTAWGAACARTNAGFYLERARAVSLRHCAVRWAEPRDPGYGPTLETHEIGDLELHEFRGAPGSGSG